MFTGVELGLDIVEESDPEPVSFHLPTNLPEHIEIIRSLDLTGGGGVEIYFEKCEEKMKKINTLFHNKCSFS